MRATAVALASALLVSGCTTTRVGRLGLLPNHDPLITVIVSEDRAVVRRECPDAHPFGTLLGCQASRRSRLPSGAEVRAITIVRYADQVPSALAFEIELHELCHAIASLQAIDDPCHIGNDGVRRTARP